MNEYFEFVITDGPGLLVIDVPVKIANKSMRQLRHEIKGCEWVVFGRREKTHILETFVPTRNVMLVSHVTHIDNEECVAEGLSFE